MIKKLIVPILVVVFGLCWMLAELSIFDINKMLWTLGLLSSGVLFYAYVGFNKTTFVLGGILIIGSILSVLRYNGIIGYKVEIPLLVMIAGILMAVNTTKLIPSDKQEVG
jgi:hypothetical protein